MPSNHFILCCPLLLPPSIFPSIRISYNESILYIRWPKCWSFSFSISPSNEYSGLVFFKVDWFTVQGKLKVSCEVPWNCGPQYSLASVGISPSSFCLHFKLVYFLSRPGISSTLLNIYLYTPRIRSEAWRTQFLLLHKNFRNGRHQTLWARITELKILIHEFKVMCVYIYIYIYIYVCVCVCVCVCILYVCIYIYIHTYTCVNIHVYMYYIYVCVCVYICITDQIWTMLMPF